MKSPMGTTLRQFIDLPAASPARAIAGGSAGRRGRNICLAKELDTPLTFEGTRAIGATLGSGVVMLFDDTVDLQAHPAAHRGFFPP